MIMPPVYLMLRQVQRSPVVGNASEAFECPFQKKEDNPCYDQRGRQQPGNSPPLQDVLACLGRVPILLFLYKHRPAAAHCSSTTCWVHTQIESPRLHFLVAIVR